VPSPRGRFDQKCDPDGGQGRAVQVDPMKPMLKPPGIKQLKLKCDILLSTFAFKFNLRRHSKVLEYRSEKVEKIKSGGEASASFSSSQISDPLRATVVCTNSHVMVKALEAMTTGIPALTSVLRLKNKLAELKKPLNLHVNLVFQPAGATPVTVEIQFMHEAGPGRPSQDIRQHNCQPSFPHSQTPPA